MRKSYVFSPEIVLFLLFLLSSLLFIIVFISRQYVPVKFLYDEVTLRNFLNTSQTCRPWDNANGYICTAIVYRTFNITLSVSIAIASIIIPFSFLIFPFSKFVYFRFSALRLLYIFLIAFAWGTAAAIFNSGLNKELLANIIIVITLLFIRLRKLILASIPMLIYGLYIRPYWIIVILFAWVSYSASKKLGMYAGLLSITISLIIITFFGALILHTPLTFFRTTVNDTRIGSEDARSMIMPFFDVSNPILEAINMLATWFSLIFPWFLVLIGGISQLTVFVLVPTTVYMIVRAWKEAHMYQDESSVFCCSLILSFLAVQAIFEPDYGSFVRHLCGFMPFGIWAISRANLTDHYSSSEDKIFYA